MSTPNSIMVFTIFYDTSQLILLCFSTIQSVSTSFDNVTTKMLTCAADAHHSLIIYNDFLETSHMYKNLQKLLIIQN